MSSTSRFIAERRLFASEKGSQRRREVVFKISEPFVAKQEEVDFPVDGATAGCHVRIEGLDEPAFTVYGMDSLQAVNIASNIESLVTRLSTKFDFFWASGEPYFDE